ncbi:hypothetical protein C2S51_010469 [Perilla frutescens var. frutescens]|nr:hypothetical protein C2S51_010469 [Perilla frutescens var. frutescens]
MVGLSDQFHMIRDELIKNRSGQVGVKINGMAGIGKTTLARRLFHDSLIKASFECRAFVRIGRKYEFEKILESIIAQVNILDDDNLINMEGDGDLQTRLKGRKCLIVLDDVWEFDFFRQLIKTVLPNEDKRIRILIMSRETHKYLDDDARNCFRLRFLNKEESWELLKRKVFGEDECPYHLEKAGKKIAENCEGLPLLIVTVAKLLLSQAQIKNVPEFWKEVADLDQKQNSVFEEALDQILKVLSPSYHFLPHYLKMCFLYFGAFPKNYEIRRSEIVNLWSAEGFFDPYSGGNEYEELVSRNLVVVRRRSRINDKTKACSLHCGYRHLTKREVEKIKFIHILNSSEDASIDSLKTHRCLSFYKNVLFAIKEVYDALTCITTIRSLLCTGPYHQYQVPICLESRLMRVLDALTIRFYEFPDEVVKLIQLRYLALTCDANLPPSISKLLNLEYLIVQQHMSISRVVAESYVPVEIWDLRTLKHLQIKGRNLPDPPHPGRVLPDLRTLLDVGVESCTKEVLESVPSLEKLRIQIDDAQRDLSCFDHISCLHELKSLQSVIMYPEILPIPPRILSFVISSIEKLSLSGLGYPWEDMSKIARLPCLKVLKLRCYAFRGEKWETKENEFLNLEYLFIEDTDLVQWTSKRNFFAKLRFLSMKNCYQFEVIPFLPFFSYIEMVDCNPLAENRVRQRVGANIAAHYSWNS